MNREIYETLQDAPAAEFVTTVLKSRTDMQCISNCVSVVVCLKLDHLKYILKNSFFKISYINNYIHKGALTKVLLG